MERPGQCEKSNKGTRGKAALQRAIKRSSAICGCEGSRITASYRAAGRRGSRVPNRQVMSLRARPLSYIGENASSRIKLSFGNGLFLLLFSSSTCVQFPFIPIHIQDLIRFITTLRVLD